MSWILEISDVSNFVLKESEGIDRYDFNRIDYSPPGRLTITTAIPLTFHMDVASVRVSLYAADAMD